MAGSLGLVRFLKSLGRARFGLALALVVVLLPVASTPVLAVNRPTVTLTVTSGDDHGTGWYRDSGATLLLTATPSNSGTGPAIKKIFYGIVDPASTTGLPVWGFISASTKSIVVDSEGTTGIYYYAVDNGGTTSLGGPGANVENPSGTTGSAYFVQVDRTAPTFTFGLSSQPNASGWYKTIPTVTFTCSDNGPGGVDASGLASACPTSLANPYTADGQYSEDVTISDVAGNSTTITVAAKIDTTPPTIDWEGAQDPSNPYTPDQTVSITCTATDDTSGVATNNGCQNVNAAASSFGIGSHTLSATVTDVAGNSSTQSVTFAVQTSGEVAKLTSISPTSGGVFGGSKVTLKGKNLQSVTGVSFGSVAATDFSATSDTAMTVTVPSSASGTGKVPVTLLNPGGTSAVAGSNWFTYVAPKVTGFSPSSGPAAGGTSVLLSGAGLAGVTGVTFAGASASITPSSDKQILATTPAAPSGAGQAVVTLSGPGGLSFTLTKTFTFLPPKLTSISPMNGPIAGGTVLTLKGSLLTGATDVTFGGVSAKSSIVQVSDTQLKVTAPAQTAPGAVSIAVVTPSGTTPPVKAGQFTYLLPSITGVSPKTGSTSGGTPVTIHGKNFTGVTGVKFGATAAASWNYVSSTTITAVSPAASSAGKVDVTVATGGGASSAVNGDAFTYTAPKATSSR
jgi:hypothetical protein